MLPAGLEAAYATCIGCTEAQFDAECAECCAAETPIGATFYDVRPDSPCRGWLFKVVLGLHFAQGFVT